MAKQKIREPFHLRNELRLTPFYLLGLVWALFTVFMIGWIIAASLSLFFYHAVKQQRFDIPPTDIRLETAEEAAQAQWVQREA